MAFQKGQSGNPKGRAKGQENYTTKEFKEQLNNLLEWSAPKMRNWLEQIAEDSPEKAFDILSKFAEYIYPKLARTDIQNLDEHGKPSGTKVTIEMVNAGNKDTNT